MRGTLLNTATVAVGATGGLLVGSALPGTTKQIALAGIGLACLGIGVKLFLQSRNVLIPAAAMAIGGAIGLALGIDSGIERMAEWARQTVGGQGRFSEGLITASVLFCVGPMTILGCLKDGLEGDTELLALKSTMDGVAALFFASAFGRDGGLGVLLSALVVLGFQGALTLLARPLRRLAEDAELIAEMSAAGGTMILAIGLSLLEIQRLPVASYLPALALAPLMVAAGRRTRRPTGGRGRADGG